MDEKDTSALATQRLEVANSAASEPRDDYRLCTVKASARDRASTVIDLSVGGRLRPVRATEVQRWLQAAEHGRLTLTGARIVGTLTLAQQRIAAGITFQNCELPDGIDVSGATLRSL